MPSSFFQLRIAIFSVNCCDADEFFENVEVSTSKLELVVCEFINFL